MLKIKEINPKQTKRAEAFELWMKAPMPMVTIFKALDISDLIKKKKKNKVKLNMLMCWCIGKAASSIEEFYMLPVGEKLVQYDKIAVNTVVTTQNGGISTCDIPFSDDIKIFNRDYLKLTKRVYDTCKPYDISDEYMVIGTSALINHDIDGVVNIYAGTYNNPFVIWGKYKKKLFKSILKLSFQFHHTQMDGDHAGTFLDRLQKKIKHLKIIGCDCK